jgi:hypothetical protein
VISFGSDPLWYAIRQAWAEGDMAQGAITARQAARDALDFTLSAWREAWAVQGLFAAGLAMIFVGLRGRLPAILAADLLSIGLAVSALIAAALAGALLRLRIGGSALRGLGPGGLQFGLAELRLMVIGLAAGAAALLAWLPVVALSAVVFILLRDAGMADIPFVGPLRVSFLFAAVVWIAAAAVFAHFAARIALAVPASVGKRRLVVMEAWRLGQDQAGAILGGLALSAFPLIATVAAAVLLDSMAVMDPAWGAMSRWPLPDAIIAGTVLGAVVAFVQAPLSLGVLAAVYCAQRTRRMERTAVPHRVNALRSVVTA